MEVRPGIQRRAPRCLSYAALGLAETVDSARLGTGQAPQGWIGRRLIPRKAVSVYSWQRCERASLLTQPSAFPTAPSTEIRPPNDPIPSCSEFGTKPAPVLRKVRKYGRRSRAEHWEEGTLSLETILIELKAKRRALNAAITLLESLRRKSRQKTTRSVARRKHLSARAAIKGNTLPVWEKAVADGSNGALIPFPAAIRGPRRGRSSP